MGGELKSDLTMMAGYEDIYGPRDTDPNSFKESSNSFLEPFVTR